MTSQGNGLPGDFTPVSGMVPEWIDIGAICKDAKRFVGLYAVANFDVVAINNGRAVYTTSDRNGEFRRNLRRIFGTIKTIPVPTEPEHVATVVYDCEEHHQWLAPRESAVKFLYEQFN
jgi:hypothetical protein